MFITIRLGKALKSWDGAYWQVNWALKISSGLVLSGPFETSLPPLPISFLNGQKLKSGSEGCGEVESVDILAKELV